MIAILGAGGHAKDVQVLIREHLPMLPKVQLVPEGIDPPDTADLVLGFSDPAAKRKAVERYGDERFHPRFREQIFPDSWIGPEAVLGEFVIIHVGAQVHHDCEIGGFSFIGPGAVCCGGVRVGLDSFIGANATILPRISIGDCAIVGAGSVVTRDVANNEIVAGNPAKPLRRYD